jgi:site-specific recombinase
VFGFGTALAMQAAAALQMAGEVEFTGRKKGLKQLVVWILELLGPTGVGIIGGLICALCLWTLVQRLKAPPHLQILQPKPYQAQSALVTALKYIALFAVWALFLPPLLR